MDKLRPYEINDLLSVINYCDKNEWERTRLIMYLIAQVNSTKKININELIKFPWDKNDKDLHISNNDIQRLKDKSKLISEKYIK